MLSRLSRTTRSLATTASRLSVNSTRQFYSSIATMSDMGPLQQTMEEKIRQQLAPVELNIKNESHLHRHHAPMQGVTSTETHFRVTVVSDQFAGKSLMQRHRIIYKLLAAEMAAENGIHALALNTKTPEEYNKA